MFLASRMAAVANPFSFPKLASYSFCVSSDLCEWSGDKKKPNICVLLTISHGFLPCHYPLPTQYNTNSRQKRYHVWIWNEEIRAAKHAGCDTSFDGEAEHSFLGEGKAELTGNKHPSALFSCLHWEMQMEKLMFGARLQ